VRRIIGPLNGEGGGWMRRRLSNQLVLDLDGGGKRHPPEAAPEELLQALADLLLEALSEQSKPVEREARDAYQDHV
jgi:hypothetical protein